MRDKPLGPAAMRNSTRGDRIHSPKNWGLPTMTALPTIQGRGWFITTIVFLCLATIPIVGIPFALAALIYVDSVKYGDALKVVQLTAKQMVKNKTAATGATSWTVNGSSAQGKKMVNDNVKLMLRAFNAEAENSVKTIRAGHLAAAKKRERRRNCWQLKPSRRRRWNIVATSWLSCKARTIPKRSPKPPPPLQPQRLSLRTLSQRWRTPEPATCMWLRTAEPSARA